MSEPPAPPGTKTTETPQSGAEVKAEPQVSIASDWPRRVAILGVGLLGGSVGLALRRRSPSVEITGLVRSPTKGRIAAVLGAIDRSVDTVADACRNSDVVVVATPVDTIARYVVDAAAACRADCLITDVGSTKANIVASVSKDPCAAKKFIAAHPIAGGEKAGVENASAMLFHDRLVVITPDESSSYANAAKARQFWQLTGARTLFLPPVDHDAHLASTSHVPHLVASALARLVTAESRPLVGQGWLDATRIAAGDPRLWTAIVAENRTAILAELKRFAGQVDEMVKLIDSADDAALARWLAGAKQIRDDQLRE